jgi:hypothetical protein
MANNILNLAMKVTADASGVVKSLTPAERALENLGKQAAKSTAVFDEFTKTNQAAATAQATASQALADLSQSLARGDISAEAFAESYARLTDEIKKEAAAFQRAAQITEANISPTEKYSRTIDELDEQLRAGRISQETYNRASQKARSDLDRVGDSAKKTDKSIEALARNTSILANIEIGRLFVGGIQAIGNVFRDVAGRVSSLVATVNAGVDSLNDLSARTGIGVEALQGYSLAAKLAGVDTEQFGTAVQKLAVNIGKATPGDALDKALKDINLSLADLRALSPEQQFSDIGAAISQLPTAADRAAAAVAIFGKQGAALAPLFREGAASIEELQAKAERLGVIISETQVNNVADMNDAFDLVSATINGIIGQVIGNLAPAVTAVTNEFLKFVEEFNGTTGEGGTGIANAITDVLLQGATYFAAVFDDFINRFDSLGLSLQTTSETFNSSASAFVFVSEGLRTVANVFELAGNALSAALGKIIETLGSFVSDDLEQYGKELTRQAMIATEQNSRQLEEAASNAGQAFVGIFTGGGSGTAAQAGEGAASEFLKGLRAKIENARLPEVQVQADLASATADLDQFLSTAEGGTSAFLQQSQATLTTFSQMAAEGNLTADQIEIMNGFMENLNAELVKEKQNRQAATDAAEAQVDADRKRLDQLLQTNDEAARLEQDLLAVEREQARVSEQLAAARASDNVAQADAAAARQAELDQLQAKLEDQQQALEQGFGQGFQAAFAAVDSGIDGLIAKSQQFGQAGFDAAVRLQEGIAAAQEQAQAGILNQEAFNQEVARQQELFNNEIKNIEEADKARTQAAEDRVAAEKKQQDDAVKAQQDAYAEQQKAAEGAANEQRRVQEEVYKQQQKIFEEQQKAAAAEATRQEERLRKLNTLGEQSIKATDIRTVEGATLVTDLAASAQDPAMIQQRLQTKLLEKIAVGIGQAAANYFNTPVAIVGAARIGGIN